ncbi:MAG: hypothetical protein ACYC3W_07470 [Candidatus Nanopelagicales bacterium]
MGVLLWLLVPIAATAAAGLWVSRRGRIATPEEHERGISEMDRFREAMRKPFPRNE